MRDPKSLALATLALSTAFLAGAVLVRVPAAEAQQAPSNYGGGAVSSNNRFIAATGSVGSGMSVLWLVDTEGRRVLVYGTNNLGKDVELRAARNFEWDTKIESLNDDSQVQVEDMRRLVEKQRERDRQAALQQGKEKEKSEKGGPEAPAQGGGK
jgi:hypothetical protein